MLISNCKAIAANAATVSTTTCRHVATPSELPTCFNLIAEFIRLLCGGLERRSAS
jgi:hypothetical protein